MKILISFLFAIPLFASAQEKEACRFAKKFDLKRGYLEHQTITTKGCAAITCNHVVVCGKKFIKHVVVKSKNGACFGYTAAEALANDVTVEAEFLNAPPAK